MKKGIKLLLTYETPDGGFEWFGKAPGHSTLTAYGLWQFLEIQKLNQSLTDKLFDEALIQRLISFLETQKNNDGWTIRQGLDSLGNPPQDVSDVYIAFVLSMNNQVNANLFESQFKKMDQLAEDFKNKKKIANYKLALLGLYLLNKKQNTTAEEILSDLLSRQNSTTGAIDSEETSITRSSGDQLKIETTALTMMLLLQLNKSTYFNKLNLLIKYLTSQLNNGYWGGTQGTILSLIAFNLYVQKFSQQTTDLVKFDIFINDNFASQLAFKADPI